MTGTEVFFVDGAVGTQVEELARVLGEEKGVSDVEKYVQEISGRTDVTAAVVSESSGGVLAKLSEERIESAYNQLFAIAALESSGGVDNIAEVVAKDIAEHAENGVAGLRVLNSLYNVTKSGNARAAVFGGLAELAGRTQTAAALVAVVPRISAMVNEWGVKARKQGLVSLLALRKAFDEGQLSNEAYAVELAYLTASNLEEMDIEQIAQVAKSAIVRFANLSGVCDVDALAGLPTVQTLVKLEKLATAGGLLENMLGSDYEQWQKYSKENHEDLTALGVDLERAGDKMRLLTLASLAAERVGQPIEYTEIAKAIDVEEDDVELWVIDVVRSGLVQGKMHQGSRTLVPSRSTFRHFGTPQWQHLAQRLDEWRVALDSLLPVVRNAREIAQQQANNSSGQARVTIAE
ncbi:hypothetical protein COEREDRAFT_83851 [Coemansia reversa NRRL 1564]|uniref:PCI domain-containing protein n=1 Tax=Coemansia reversa (strain ATCC 12441 / NRRL 1564) TaxID=763665 RepID=A0A2G5B1L1_COERN|nr:hypothetical protein COEREDRAFT_83851 [Coemansia reversa NRRL 1564]|eukprot:PIA12886.1 hypothetical protein COEREDRAFT_83851 [Coemansia reversa NRRL 1564]